MVTSRRSRVRDYKEKRKTSAFGRIILPLTLVLAFALLYLSIKLFFLGGEDETAVAPRERIVAQTSEPVIEYEETNEEPSVAETPDDTVAEPENKEDDAGKTAEETNSGQAAKPASEVKAAPIAAAVKKTPPQSASANKTPASQTKTGAQTKKTSQSASASGGTAKRTQSAAKPASSQTQTKKTSAGSQTASAASSSAKGWDVQIGGFSNKEGAELTVKQAQAAGYSARIVNSTLNGKPFYKVRVAGGGERSAAEALSKKLEKEGFPVFLAPAN